MKGLDVETRFWNKVRIGDGCWEWTGAMNRSGYGTFRMRGSREQLVHRFCWIFERGPIPAGLCVLHRCDNRKCIRPSHLFLGTWADNAADKKAKGRCHDSSGEANGHAKLTKADVLAIRAAHANGETCRSIRERLEVSDTLVRKIVRRELWPNVEAKEIP